MSISSVSGERAQGDDQALSDLPATAPATTSPGWVLARRWTQLASPIVVALVAYWVRRLS
jgi:hypothetical protein